MTPPPDEGTLARARAFIAEAGARSHAVDPVAWEEVSLARLLAAEHDRGWDAACDAAAAKAAEEARDGEGPQDPWYFGQGIAAAIRALRRGGGGR